MIWLVICALVLGIVVGRMGWFADFFLATGDASSWLLCLLLFVVGIGLGQNKEIWIKLRRMGWKVLMIPAGVAVGSLLGALLMGYLIRMPANESLSVGAGFAWYSLSGLMIKGFGNVELGAIALLSNCFREFLAILLLPILARYMGKVTALAPGGAACMDTLLPLIDQTCGKEISLLGFISGVILTGMVPILVPLFYYLGG